MNNSLILILLSIVLFTYFGGQYIPRVLKVNKHWLAAFVIGFIFCSLFHGYEGLNFPKIHLGDLPGAAGRLGSKLDHLAGAEKKMATDLANTVREGFKDRPAAKDGHNSSANPMNMMMEQIKRMGNDVKKAQMKDRWGRRSKDRPDAKDAHNSSANPMNMMEQMKQEMENDVKKAQMEAGAGAGAGAQSGSCGLTGETVRNGVYKGQPCDKSYAKVVAKEPADAGPYGWCGKGGQDIQGCTWTTGSVEEANSAPIVKPPQLCPSRCVVGKKGWDLAPACPSGCISP